LEHGLRVGYEGRKRMGSRPVDFGV
jgi:hypothetical protein